MKKYLWIIGISLSIGLAACKGNGSTGASDEKPGSDSVSLNDGTGAPGSGTGSAGSATVGDTTVTQQDSVKGAPAPKGADTASRR